MDSGYERLDKGKSADIVIHQFWGVTVKITEQLIDTGNLLGIHVLDHLVLGSSQSANGQGFVSIRELEAVKF